MLYGFLLLFIPSLRRMFIVLNRNMIANNQPGREYRETLINAFYSAFAHSSHIPKQQRRGVKKGE
jgi:hypothetical protein